MTTDTDIKDDDLEQEELSPVEKRAASMGWAPQDKWRGDPDDWKDAKTFIRDGELMQRITEQRNAIDRYKAELRETQEAIRKLGEHNAKIAEMEYKKAVKDLKQQKVRALKNEDHEAVIEIDEQLDELKEQQAEVKKTASDDKETDKKPHPEAHVVDTWLKAPENEWYHKNKAMKLAADGHFMELSNSGEYTLAQALKKTEEFIKEEFAHKFEKKKEPHQMVAEPDLEKGGTPKSGKKFTTRHLSEEQAKIAKVFVSSGVFKTAQEYVDQLAELGELPAQQKG